MKRVLASALTVLLLLFVGVSAAQAVLERVGPINNASSVGGYPAWYQDTTGIALEFCDPQNLAEVNAASCLIGLAEVPNVPEVFPTSFFDEHFYYGVSAEFPTNPLKKILWEAAVEAVFTGDLGPGGHQVFSRIRVRLEDVPVTGTYRFIHPYGEEVIQGTAGGRIFFTDDVGIACPPGNFDCAMTSRLGPFLLPSNSPGGAELPPFADPAVPGKLYIAAPARIGPVTGSPLGRNLVRIEGPAGSNLDGAGNDFIQATDFTLMGRLFTDVIAGRVTIDRASYARSTAGQSVEVYATGFATKPGRVPGQPNTTADPPVLSFFDAACTPTDVAGNLGPPFSAPAGGTETQMAKTGNNYWGDIAPASLPAAVCVKDSASKDAGGNLVPAYFPKNVTDQIFITQARFDKTAHSLSVNATSSDELTPPTLTLTGFTATYGGGGFVAESIAAPPATIQVMSSAGGVNTFQVSTRAAASTSGITLTVVKGGNGSGTVSPVPVGSSIPFDLNTVVTLTATPAIGSTFNGFSGGCTGAVTCDVTMAASTTVIATFTLDQFSLSVAAAGIGSGTVSPVAAGSSATQNFGSSVTLNATAAIGSVFAGWSGDCVGTGACTVLMSQARSVTATFDVQQLTLNVVAAGTGSGTVSPVAVGGSTSVAFNTQVTLTATPNTGSVFSGWSGGGCTGTGTCTVTVTAATTVTATFDSLKAILVSPTSGTILIGSATFNWSAGSGATEYILWVGTSLGRNNLFSKSFGLNLTSGAVNNLPSDGSTIFVRLLTRNAAGLLTFNDYSFTTGSFPKAALLSPTGSPLAGPSTTFTWSAASGATEYLLWVGTAAGRNNLYSRSQGLNLSVTVTNLPTDGSTIFVRLFTRNAAGQLFTDYTFTTGP